ncbi:MAG: hypothetical protein MH252_02385, partial [Thermosynechococcaceae cyanobacterium MS004]|nr:hypothetical protein [Thermosynechococcaceae cyanobacterium MS004]
QREAQQKAQAEAAQRQAQLEAQQREAQQKAQVEAAQRQAQLEAQQREAQQKAQAEAAQRQAQLAAQQKAQAEAQQAKAQEEAAQRKAQLEAQQKRQDAALAAIEKLQPKPQPQVKSADTLLASVSPLNVAVVNQRAVSAPTSRQVCENVRINTIVVKRCREDQLQESAQAPSSSSSPESYVSSGNGKAESGRYQSAVDDYTAAISGNSSLAAAFFNRGLARYKLGQKEAAIADFSKAADLFRSQGATAQYQKTQSILQTLTQAQS